MAILRAHYSFLSDINSVLGDSIEFMSQWLRRHLVTSVATLLRVSVERSSQGLKDLEKTYISTESHNLNCIISS
jgi:hypothetical protein